MTGMGGGALVERSADPDRVRVALDLWSGDRPDLLEILDSDGALAARVVAVLAASRSLAGTLREDPEAIDLLRPTAPRPIVPPPGGRVADLVRWKRRELLRIAGADLVGALDLEQVVVALSELATDVLGAALGHARSELRDDHLAVVGMGKLGGRELNYASDVDLLLVGEGDPQRLERAGRALLEVAARCFRVDADLRPEGRDGSLVRSVDAFEAYWRRWADAWERQALLKARTVTGDAALGAQWSAAAEAAVWGVPFDADDLRHVRALKVKAEEDVRRRGVAEREVKRGPGGIRDVEFSAQLLQLVHGREDPTLRARGTLEALEALARGGYVDRGDADDLADSYRFLRRVEHALQLDEERQTHTVPADREERRRIARILGYQGNPEGGPTHQLDRDLLRRRAKVRTVHERVWFRPLLEALAGAGALGEEAAADRLEAFGFTDLERTRQAVRELTRGLTRSSRMMQQLMPLLLDWLSTAPDPDLGLLGLRRLASGEDRSRALASEFRESPEVARHLALLLGSSRQLGDILVANPDLIERLPVPERLLTQGWDSLVTSARASLAWRGEPEERQRALQRWQRRNLLGIAARDLFDHASVDVVGSDLSVLAEASLEAALEELAPKVPVAVVAFGRLGGAELGYASDLDVAFVHDGAGEADAAEAERVAAGLLRFLGGGTPAERVWTLDAAIRPEGRNGPLARSIEGWRAYLARWASTWERQAYLRVRAVAGAQELGDRLVGQIHAAIWSRPFADDDVREVRRMKVRIEQERLAPGEDPEFHLKLGRGSLSDIEFTVQLLQLRHGVPGARTLGALDALVEAGHLPLEEADVLAEAYRFCERARNRSFLVVGPGDSLPIAPEKATPLARSLGLTVTDLRAEYRRVTRRARRIVERRFYDRG